MRSHEGRRQMNEIILIMIPPDAVDALLNVNMEVAFPLNNEGQNSLNNASLMLDITMPTD